ncbi:hypothetical protein [Shimia sp.]|uniref:hypothetical protein n=1 Tax=Shimia sp. TaxID=1954381 RepID=UPI003B8DD025
MEKYTFLTLIAFGVLALSAIFWVWLCLGIRKRGLRRSLAIGAIQISIVTALYALIRGAYGEAFLNLFGPLPAAYFMIANASKFTHFVSHFAIAGLACFIVSSLLSILVKATRPWFFGIATIVALLGMIVAAESVSKTAMCEAATQAQLGDFQRNTFYWSLANAPREFQFQIHALAIVDDKAFGWSYRKLDWYEIPHAAQINVWVSGETASCQ